MRLTHSTLTLYEIQSDTDAHRMLAKSHKTRDRRLEHAMAVKVLDYRGAGHPGLKLAETLTAASHPPICPIHDVWSEDGIDFVVMESRGRDAGTKAEEGALPLDRALQVGLCKWPRQRRPT